MTIPIDEKPEEESGGAWIKLEEEWYYPVADLATVEEHHKSRRRRQGKDLDEKKNKNADEDETTDDDDGGSTANNARIKHDETGFFNRLCMKIPCYERISKRWPRLCSLCFGVLLPHFMLILLAVLFGIWLAMVESPAEVEGNNIQLAGEQASLDIIDQISTVTRSFPRICLIHYFDNSSDPFVDIEDALKEEKADVLKLIQLSIHSFAAQEGSILSGKKANSNSSSAYMGGDDDDELVVVNTTDMQEFMQQCGVKAENLTDQLVAAAVALAVEHSGELSFNWIRCWAGAGGDHLSFGSLSEVVHLRPEAQAKFFADAWHQNQQALFQHYLSNLTKTTSTTSRIQARQQAYVQSLREASGGSSCDLNASGSAWFWFTVMTTVGYGNQAPVTERGRMMVFTAGFFCILAFGFVLATSGFITLAIFDDAVSRMQVRILPASRMQLRILAVPWVACLFWGAIWYCWMTLVASVTQQWKWDRLQRRDDYTDMYWFAYISTTTVGLGDIFFEPEVFIAVDLITFPLLFLAGFVFVSAFLGKFTELLQDVVVGRGKTSMVSTLIGHLNNTNIVPDVLHVDDKNEHETKAAGGGGSEEDNHSGGSTDSINPQGETRITDESDNSDII